MEINRYMESFPFKAGDRITWNSKNYSYVIERVEKEKVFFDPSSAVDVISGEKVDNSYWSTGWMYIHNMVNPELHTIEIRKNPIVEKIITTIEPGTYGNLLIYYVNDDLRIEFNKSAHTPTELRDSAKILSDIADFLEKE